MIDNNAFLKLKIENDGYNTNSCLSLDEIEFEIIIPDESNSIATQRRNEINKELEEIDLRLDTINKEIEKYNEQLDSLINHADGLDNIIAVASGVVAGIIDSVWVGEFSLDAANDWGNEKTESFVIKIAQNKGYKGDDLYGAIKFLEGEFPIAADKATNTFGGGNFHHLRDFAHHPTPVGLFFSMLTQFTGNAYGTDVTGAFMAVPVDATTLIGKNLPEKITFGAINWFFHMVSDMAGSSTSVKMGKLGTGLPGPITSFLKEISALPIFNNMNEKGYKEFSVWIQKLFDGTLLGPRDENGKIIGAVKFDLRTEIGVVHELGKQAIPIVLNECIVRGFYFVRRLYDEIREKEINNIADLKKIDWKKTLPFKNRTIARMLTVSLGTFMAVDVADAAIRSGGINPACLLRINFVGVGRLVVAIGTDAGMGMKKNRKEYERNRLLEKQIGLLNAKMYYRKADLMYSFSELYESMAEMHHAEQELWIEVQSVEDANRAFIAISEAIKSYAMEGIEANIETYVEMGKISTNEIENINPGLLDDIFRR